MRGSPRPDLDKVEGWFIPVDQALFTWLLAGDQPGDLLELGVFHGKSAIHIGRYRRPEETFTVCDLFAPYADHRDVSQETFEANYLMFHPALPVVVRAPTAEIGRYVAPGSCRFAHVDAAHDYDNVRADVLSVRSLLRPDGVAAFDDYRLDRFPGTGAAVWEAVATGGLRPVCVSANKFYGTWGDPAPHQAAIERQVAQGPGFHVEDHRVMGQRLLRVWPTPARSRRLRHTARAVLPDVAVRAVRRARGHLAGRP